MFLSLNNVSAVKKYEHLEFLNQFKLNNFKTEMELLKKTLGKS